jgi:hypothetical protein
MILQTEEFFKFSSILSWKEFDDYLFIRYGLMCLGGFGYQIKDESKFTIFMLKYSEHIRKIST